jgi:hypothetical protein
MRILFVLVLALVVVAAGLLVAMFRRTEPMLGLHAVGLLTLDGILAITYGFLTA